VEEDEMGRVLVLVWQECEGNAKSCSIPIPSVVVIYHGFSPRGSMLSYIFLLGYY
jgi:hypothetical protein